jgi:uncharacterized protein YggT (Ycf19 family)
MALIDLIVNLACLLLWLNWRSLSQSSPAAPGLTLVSTLKSAHGRRNFRWLLPVGIAAILLIRSIFYWHIGAAVSWTPKLDLGAVSISFRSDIFLRAFSFSLLSFGLLLGAVYWCLLLISALNRNVPDSDPFQRMVRAHLGWLDRLPAALKLILPLLAVTGLWVGGHRLLVHMGVVPPPLSSLQLWQQGALLGLTSLFVWKYFLVALLLAYLLNSYIYLGTWPVWNFVNATGTRLLSPLRFARLGKLDLAPLIALSAILFLSQLADSWLPTLYQHIPY